MSEAKKALEQAIGRIGKAYGDLLRVAEKHGHEISKEDYAKAQFFMSETINKIWDKVDVVRDVAKATSGEFSLDSIEVPASASLKIMTPAGVQEWQVPAGAPFSQPVEAPRPQIDPSKMDGRSLAQAIGGRLTKQAKANIQRPAPSVNIDLDDDDDTPSATTTEDDLLDDVDFIDDK
ncbi:hypothetical protein HJA82_29280 [Rhizobium bangladeshense]|uniref:hypothetical protein n=1 Tax=Rhizobium bangladeshense TaxID=1138189 RepID=UPI001C82ACAF|nr:hypothetical protein [Rhizobium bangladeshense]MBX4911408.1 hypothetical protein [Rhizobium bangladeshense]